MCSGKVALVGAGPGDAGLITVKGAEALRNAEVVVYDRLVGDGLLDLCPRSAELIYVGKTQGNHPIPQHEINDILLRKAREGKFVVRLKGGDPYLFGRGSEEAEHLAAHGVEFAVIPGVTSAFAALSYAGIPATSRDKASSVHVVTGHARAGGCLDIDYDALARTKGTLVFLMAVSSMNEIVSGLLNAGMDPSTPAAVVQEGTTPRQRRVLAPLSQIVDAVRNAHVISPAILAVGGVCDKAETLGWFDKQPLFGVTVAVTRPAERMGTLTNRLRSLGADVVAFPCIETNDCNNEGVRAALENLDSYAWLVLTSPKGAQRVFEQLGALGLDARALAGVKIACIGPGTSAQLAAHGIAADYLPQSYDSAHLAQGLAKRCSKDDRILLLRAAVGAPDVVEAIERCGAICDDVAAYETVPASSVDPEALARMSSGTVDYVTFTSASTVSGFASLVPNAPRDAFKGICIGAATETEARNHGFTTVRSRTATIDGVIEALIKEVRA